MPIFLKYQFPIFVIENLGVVQQNGDDFLIQSTQISLNHFMHLQQHTFFTLLFSVIIGSALMNETFIFMVIKMYKLQ